MSDPKQIPDEVVEAAAQAFRQAMHDHWGWEMLPWHEVLAEDQEYWRKQTRAAITAALAAWPMAQYRAWDDVQGVGLFLILPLPQEASVHLTADEQAAMHGALRRSVKGTSDE